MSIHILLNNWKQRQLPSINLEDKVSLKYIMRQFLKCQKIFIFFSKDIFAEILQFTQKYLVFSKGGPFEYFRKYILRQFLKCQKIFKGIFSRKFYNLRENIVRVLPLNIFWHFKNCLIKILGDWIWTTFRLSTGTKSSPTLVFQIIN